MIKNRKLARKYAHALFKNSLGNNIVLKVYTELSVFVQSLTEEILSFLYHPKITKKEKKYIVSEVCEQFNFSEELISFVCILINNNRMKLIFHICEYFNSFKDNHEFLTRGFVGVTKTINEELIVDIQKEFESKLKKKITWKVEIDNSLLGGFKVAIGDTVYDASIKNKLDKLSEFVVGK